MNVFAKAEEFNKSIININRSQFKEIEDEEFKWLIGVLKEEIQELQDAFNEHDFVQQVDAVIDLIYFAAGALTRMGISEEKSNQIFDVVHQCNMQKTGGRKKERDIQNDLDAVKPSDWTDPSQAIVEILNEKV